MLVEKLSLDERRECLASPIEPLVRECPLAGTIRRRSCRRQRQGAPGNRAILDCCVLRAGIALASVCYFASHFVSGLDDLVS